VIEPVERSTFGHVPRPNLQLADGRAADEEALRWFEARRAWADGTRITRPPPLPMTDGEIRDWQEALDAVG
jgi:hypothetical protein